MPDTNAGATTKSRHRWLRFSLRTLFVVAILISLFLAWIGRFLVHVRHQRDIAAKLQALNAAIYYDYQIQGDTINVAAPPPGPKVIRYFLGDDAFANVEGVYLYHDRKNSDNDLALLAELPKLKRVFLLGHDITDNSMPYVVQVPQLRELMLYDTSVTADGLARLHAADGLQSLYLRGRSVNDETLKHLDKLPNLQSLCLEFTEVTSAGFEHLAGLTQLRELNLDYGGTIDDEGLRHIAHLRNLETLGLTDKSITDAGVVHLRGMSRLKDLRLSGTFVSDSGLQHLAGLRNLERLVVGRYVNKTAAEELKRLLPRCDVEVR